MFITFEGPDGSGKTTLIKKLVAYFEPQLKRPLLVTREPGGDPLAEEIRQVILDPKHGALDPKAEALLYAASRCQHLSRVITPALVRGQVVFCDRYVDSSLAYQGYGRGLGVEAVRAINRFALETVQPDLTLYLRLPATVGLERIQAHRSEEMNRLDLEALAFHERVVAGYEALYQAEGQRIVALPAEKNPAEVFTLAKQAIEERFPQGLEGEGG